MKGWIEKRLKFVATYNDESLPETTDPDYAIEYVDISSVNLIEGIVCTEDLVFEKAPSRARRLVQHGDTIVSTVRTYLKAIAPIYSPPSNLVVSTGFAVIRPANEIDSRYMAYVLQSKPFVDTVVANSTGVSYPAISPSRLVCIRIRLPRVLAEQHQIADFLDWKTGQIDRLIAKKRALVSALSEKRMAVITQAVTRGLDPTVPMKDSGINWLGKVPKHWPVVRVKFVADMDSGHTPSRTQPENWIPDECVIPWVSLNDTKYLKKHDLISDTSVKISETGMANSTAHLLPSETVVFTRDATIGLTAITACLWRSPSTSSRSHLEKDLLPNFCTDAFKQCGRNLKVTHLVRH